VTRPVAVTDRTALGQVLRTLKLSGMLATLDARLTQAAGELGHLDFLQVLCEDEISRRASGHWVLLYYAVSGGAARAVTAVRDCVGQLAAKGVAGMEPDPAGPDRGCHVDRL
jgi:hypothetical protein